MLTNGLVNNYGKSDSFFKADRFNKLLNLQLKDLLQLYSNSTFRVDTLFKWSVFITSYTRPLRNKFKRAFNKKTNTFYIIKSPTIDI